MDDEENDPLAHIVDDTQARKQCIAWIYAQIISKRTPEEIEADLVGNGWNPDDVAIMVDEVRKDTRESRGVFTRQQAADDSEAYYRRALRGPGRLGI
jgi:hypothetical protein